MKLREDYPQEEIIGYFYNPNIHPIYEYEARYIDTKRSCDILGITLIKGEYEYNKWYKMTKKFAGEPERGARCQKCFDIRFLKTALMAKKLGQKIISTTLLMSPKKNFNDLVFSMERICKKFDLDFIAPDYRKNSGTQKQFLIAKELNLYHQNYCGCYYGLNSYKSFNVENQESIENSSLPSSPKDRFELFSKVYEKFQNNEEIKISKKQILNYRLLYGKVSINNCVVDSAVLIYSHFNKARIKFVVDEICDEFIAGDVILLSIKRFNEMTNNNFKTLKEIKNINFYEQIRIREKIVNEFLLNPIIILNNQFSGDILIQMKDEIFPDVIDYLK